MMKRWVERLALWLLGLVSDRCPYCQCPIKVKESDRQCAHCQIALPADALKSHDGVYRCASCKVEHL